MDSKRVAAYTFFWVWSGKNNKLMHSVESVVSWCKFVPNYHAGKINDSFIELINQLQSIGYISCNDDISVKPHTRIITTQLNNDWYEGIADRNERFARIYLDEIQKIMDYDCGTKSKSLTNSNILLVFAYLRLKIIVRNNIEGETPENIKRSPEVFYGYYKDISSELGINERTLSSIFQILSDLELIHLTHIRKPVVDSNGNQKWITFPTLFCNVYKRLGGFLIYDGKDYYEQETKNKIKTMNFDGIKKKKAKIEETEIDMEWIDLM